MIATLRRLVALAGISRRRAAVPVVLGTMAVGFGVGLMTTAGYLISRAAEHPPILSLTVAIVGVRFFGLARPVARYCERIASHDLALRALGRVRSRFYEAIEPLAPAQLQKYRSGDLVARMVADVDALQGLYLRSLTPPLVALSVGAVCVGVTAAILPAAALVLAVGLLAGGVVVPVLARPRAHARQAEVRGELTAELVEVLRGAPELVVNGAEDLALARVGALDGELVRLGRRDALLTGLADSLSIVVVGATVTGVLAVAIAAHDAATLDRVLVAALALLALSSFEAVAPLPAAARELSSVVASGGRVLELIDSTSSVHETRGPHPLPPQRPAIALEGVTARYDGSDRPALTRFDLRLDHGRRVALVGPSGSGKTTVVNLLLRFLDPERGRVTIGGRDARDYRLHDVRATFALAGQEAHLFTTSIRENLLLARPEASADELDDALRRARLADWVAALPDGLETLVGEEGKQLSGGQRQRLVLARALLVDAPVIVLDEPTVHLSADTARELVADMLTATSDRTVLLITHRPEGLDLVDEVIALP